jgi:hypothetical protein
MADQVETFESWAVVELMGHVRMAGRLTEEERFGGKMGRLDVPGEEERWTTVYFTAASVYRITPCSEEAARAVALRSKPEPVHQWELPAPKRETDAYNDDDDVDDDDDEEALDRRLNDL